MTVQNVAALEQRRERSLIRQILAFSTPADCCHLWYATMGALVQGALMPVMTLVFGTLAAAFADIASGEISTQEFLKTLAKFSLYFVYLAIGEFVGSYAMWIGFTIAGESITNRIRRSLLLSVFNKGPAFLDESGTAEVTNLLSSDADAVNHALSSKLGRVIAAFMSVVVAFIVAFSRSWRLTLIMGSGLFAFAIAGGSGAYFITRFTKQSLSNQSEAASVAQEAISGIACTMANSAEKLLAARYSQKLSKGYKPAILARLSGEMMIAVITSIATCLFSLAFWKGARYYVNNEAEFADILIVLLAVLLGTASLGLVGPNAQAVAAGFTAAGRIFAMMRRPASIDSMSDEGQKPTHVRGDIRFEQVQFAYPTRADVPILKRFDLHIPAGSTTALVGQSGCGKSTIIKLLQRFYDPTDGRILLDGHPLPSLSVQWLRKHVAVVSQEPDLFNISIYDNIRYGLVRSGKILDEAETRKSVESAARSANIHQMIMNMPDGYETIVGERGSRLSGGQRQRVAIARALIADPKILLLDEATSALDTVSESFVQEALTAAGGNRTVVIIAHRLSTIKHAENIVVMTPEGIAEQGRYDELMQRMGLFYNLQNKQSLTQSHHLQLPELDEIKTASLGRTNAPGSEAACVQSIDSTSPLLPGTTHLSGTGIQNTNRSSNEPTGLKSVLWHLLSATRESHLLSAFGLLWAVVSGCASTIQAYLFANAVTSFAQRTDDDRHFISRVDFWAGMLVALAGAQVVASALRGLSLAISSERFLMKSRTEAFERILQQEMSFFDEEGTARLTDLLSARINELNSLTISSLAIFVVGFTGLFTAIGLSIGVNWKLGLVFTAAVPILLASGYLHGAFTSKREEMSRQAYADAVALGNEAIDCLTTAVSLGLERHFDQQLWESLSFRAQKSARKAQIACTTYAVSQACVYLCFAGCFYYGGRLVGTGESSMIDFFICYTAIVTSTPSTGACFNLMPDIRKATHACKLLMAILSRSSSIDAFAGHGASVADAGAKIAADSVYFRYPTKDAQALLGINIEALPGQYIALVGPSGSGKSTILSLIERFYDPQSGAILLNGTDVRELQVGSYRKRMALITQETTLFSGTIRENILLASDNTSDDKINDALKAAALDEFISSLPDGVNTVIGYRGLSLSGGQRQRVAIARALLIDPQVLLLDEATSALDTTSERQVQESINKAAQGRTTIAVAQRLSTIRHADRIYVIEYGGVVESGTHEQLMKLGKVYAKMVNIHERRKDFIS